MTPLKSLQSRNQYTVGWITALPLERAAATAVLDEKHGTPLDFDQPRSDTNSYTWGRVGEHNVVIASLAAGIYGIASAAATALPMLSSFPQIRFGLLVGIGAGISRINEGRDIRLGDIAVGQPHGISGGVVQYDLRKAKPGQKHERRDFLNRPPEVLLKALANLQAQHELEGPRVLELLEEALTRHPHLTKSKHGYVHQGFANDHLFKAAYDHVLGTDCCNCDPKEEIQREKRDSADPEIHYGTIASGNTLIKDAATRDRILEEMGKDCICFEMEAAGLMNNFPCLAIRGICDYADSHKNDRWQRYAAATAAAYAKELLSYCPSENIQRTQKAIDILKQIAGTVVEIHSVALDARATMDSLNQDSSSNKINKWLSSPDPSINLNEAKKKRYKGTGCWFLDSNKPFKEWKSGLRQCLWLHGIPGCGKTVLSSTIVEHLQLHQDESSSTVLHFFFDFNDAKKQSVDGFTRSLVGQLYLRCQASRKELDVLFSSCSDGCHQPTTESLFETFLRMLQYINCVQIVIDALDECKARKELISWMERICAIKQADVRLLATSRREEELESGIGRWLNEENFISIQRELVDSDIRVYIRGTLHGDNDFLRWESKPDVLEEIEIKLVEKANGMFRWAACQLEALEKCLDRRQLADALMSLPETLDETYQRILVSISKQNRPYTTRILQFLTFSDRPLTIEEAVDAVVVDPCNIPPFDPELRMPRPLEIVRTCPSLVALVRRNPDPKGREVWELQLAHFSVKEYLQSGRVQDGFRESFLEVNAKGVIVSVCLAYLSQVDTNLPTADIGSAFPLAQYSAKYWSEHARTVDGQQDILARILRFFANPREYSIWGRMYDPDEPWKENAMQRPMQEPLYYASLTGLINVVRSLLKMGVDINRQGGKYGNALQAAASKGHKEIVRALLKSGASVSQSGGFFTNPLYAACYKGYGDIAEMLLDDGADPNQQGGFYGTALHAASLKGHGTVVQTLINRKADINARGIRYNSALEAAVSGNHKEIVQILIGAGSNVNTQSRWFNGTILHQAAQRGQNDITKVLLNAHAAVDAHNQIQKTALYIASENGHTETVKVLLKAGAEVDALNDQLRALYIASGNGHTETVNVLLRAGAEVNALNDQWTALCIASHNGHTAVVKLLLANDTINPNSKDNAGRTPLFFAARNGSRELFKLLLSDNRVEPDTKDHYALTPLLTAVANGREEVVELLLAIDCINFDCVDSFGRTPLWWAKRNRNSRIVKLLENDQKKSKLIFEDSYSTEMDQVQYDKASRWCDICTLGIPTGNAYYECRVCNRGGFHICLECFKITRHCLDDSHTLVNK